MKTITTEQLAKAIEILGLGDPNHIQTLFIKPNEVTVTKFVIDDDGSKVWLDAYGTSAKYVETYEVKVV